MSDKCPAIGPDDECFRAPKCQLPIDHEGVHRAIDGQEWPRLNVRCVICWAVTADDGTHVCCEETQ